MYEARIKDEHQFYQKSLQKHVNDQPWMLDHTSNVVCFFNAIDERTTMMGFSLPGGVGVFPPREGVFPLPPVREIAKNDFLIA